MATIIEQISNIFKHIIENDEFDNIDYIGVDIGTDGLSSSKTYYLNNRTLDVPIDASNKSRTFLTEMLENQLLGLIIPVGYTENKRERYDLGLSNRTNVGMMTVFSILNRLTPLFRQNKEDIIIMSKMKTVPGNSYDYAALYFVGIVFDDDDVDALKCYYITRTEYHEDHYTIAEEFNDEYYFKYIRDLSNDYLNILLELCEQLYECLDVHIYIVAVDYFHDKKKYKMYLKLNNNFSSVMEYFKTRNVMISLADQLCEIEEFCAHNRNIYIDLMGLCVDTDMNISVNLFFRFNNK